MRNTLVTGFTAAVLTTLVLPAQRLPEDVLPESTWVMARSAGLDQIADAAQELGLTRFGHQILQRIDPDVIEKWVGGHLKQAAAEVRRELGKFGFTAREVRTLLGRPVALGVGRAVAFGEAYLPSMALVIDVGESGSAFAKLLNTLEGMLQEQEPGLKTGTEAIGGHQVRAVTHVEVPGALLAASVGGYLIVSNSRPYLAECLEVLDGTRKSLAAGTPLGRIRGEHPETYLAAGFINAKPLGRFIDAAMPLLPYGMEGLPDALGARDLSGIFAGTRTAGTGTEEVLHLGVVGSEQGLFKVALSGEVDLGAASYCSVDTVAFGGISLNVPAAIESFERFTKLLPYVAQQQIHKNLHRDLSREIERLGMTPEQLEKLLSSFGPAVSLAVNLPKNLPIPEVSLFVQVNDRQRLEGFLTKITKGSPLEWKVREARQDGQSDIHYANVTVPGGVRITPCYAFHGDKLLISTSTRNLSQAMARAMEDGPSLATTEGFSRLRQECAGASAFIHTRGDQAVALMWNMVAPQLRLLVGLRGEEFGITPDVVPDAEEIAAAVGTSTCVVFVDDGGLTVRQRSNLGIGTFLAICGAMADHVLAQAGEKTN